MSEETAAVETVNPFTLWPSYRELRDSEEGYQGQIGWADCNDGPGAVYDTAAPIWEMPVAEQKGKTFFWKRAEYCLGHPQGHCHRPTHGEIYCWLCAKNYSHDMERQAIEEKRIELIRELTDVGALPHFFKAYRPPALHPWQVAVKADIEADEKACAWIFGERGHGKTVLTYEIIYTYLLRMRRCVWADSDVLYRARDRSSPLRDLLYTAPLIVLDDIDLGNNNQFAGKQIHGILQARHEPRLRTIVTSERTPETCGKKIKEETNGEFRESTVERLNFPDHRCVYVRIGGHNLRR